MAGAAVCQHPAAAAAVARAVQLVCEGDGASWRHEGGPGPGADTQDAAGGFPLRGEETCIVLT